MTAAALCTVHELEEAVSRVIEAGWGAIGLFSEIIV